MNRMGIYAFCAIRETEPREFGEVEIEGEPRKLFTVHQGNSAMVVAKAPLKIYPPLRENLRFHQDTVNRVMEEYSVLPLSFGNVFHSEGDLEVLMKALSEQFEELFPKIDGKMEVGLKIMGKKEWLEEEIRKDPQVEKVQEAVRGKSEAAAYYDRIRLGEMAQKFFLQLRKQLEEEIFQPLVEEAEAAKLNETVGEKMLLNAAFLIDRDQEEAFDRKVNELYEQWSERVDFQYTGPWPAYNFVNIRLKVEEPT
ncbi:GvpL/GvpF family gas vesicle protein [Salinithrix halophila]|uniref:GvpL/GvpF family gas vesicle protein n=1 Tax=Salinithrix halophila TaxID=1485204 RepID=A0ABV8JDF2_9BACL